MRKKAIWPNLVTAGNLFLGYLAIINIIQGKYITASWLIIIASILDGLDGLVARLVNESTPFGAEIDSFSDAVSFGVAPGLLIYHVALKPFGYIGLIFGFLPVLTGIIRLVKFNLIPEGFKSKTKFTGLPIPATAIILAGFYVYANSVQGIKTTPIFFALIPALSILMLSPIPYRKLPGTLRKTRFSIYRKITMNFFSNVLQCIQRITSHI